MIKEPYLIQRLKNPFPQKTEMTKLATSFAFGGGLKHGGLSDDAFTSLHEIWRYDYMGSSEFEWGAIPESLQRIVKTRKNYKVYEMNVESQCHYKGDKIKNTAIIHVFCNESHYPEISKWIAKFANGVKRDYYTKERVGLAESICQMDYATDVVGWHDIENDFLFFTDEEMCIKFCNLLGITKYWKSFKRGGT